MRANQRWASLLAAGSIVLTLATVARAEVAATDCFSEDNERRYAGCTAIIESNEAGDSEKSQAYSMRALSLSLKQQYEAAIHDYDSAIAINPNFAVALNNRAWAYFKWGRAADGVTDVEQSLRLNPMSEHTWDTRGHIRQVMGNPDGAFTDYQQAMIIGGARMVKIYQCGLSANGLYRGRIDGIFSDELRDALKTCSERATCDPLPADEECKDPLS
ncbi:MAG: tetratricopeptide repeat protein [Proteobacteria bacterium]|nr:tetratricopeptide repeat protein [Pseudomonadota bacterium]